MSKIAELNRLLSYMAFRIFKPLVILFLRNSVPFQTASDWLKRIYVDVALESKEFRIKPDKKQTKTRVAILTGLSRVEIDRVLKIDKPLEVTEQKWNRATKVLSGWCMDEDFTDDDKPKTIPLNGKLSFSALVKKYSGGATMRSVLDELLHVKSVEVTGELVNLLRYDYAPIPSKQKLIDLELYGILIGNLSDSISFNDIEMEYKKKRFVKMVFNREIPESQKYEMINYINQETDKLLNKIDQKLSKVSSSNDKTINYKLGLGTYYFEEVNHEN